MYQKNAAMSPFEFHHNTIANISHTDTYDGFEPNTLAKFILIQIKLQFANFSKLKIYNVLSLLEHYYTSMV